MASRSCRGQEIDSAKAPTLDWSERSRELQLSPELPLLVALSGGADSVYLLDWIRRATARPVLHALHVNHGLRGEESEADETFCRELCGRWQIPFDSVRIELDTEASDLERRARELRYSALGSYALEHGISAVLTAHHRDDLLETLLMRWMRGSSAPGLVGPTVNAPYPVEFKCSPPLRVVRPLLDLSARTIRDCLARRGLPWREDASNLSARFTRNRVRHGLLPLLHATCGARVLEDLEQFQRAIARHEALLKLHCPPIAWEKRPAKRATWRCPRRPFESTPAALLERAFYASLLGRTGRPPKDAVLRALAGALRENRVEHWNLRGGWGLTLEDSFLRLKAPVR